LNHLLELELLTVLMGIFLETHTDPSSAKSDGANMLDINKVEELLTNLLAIRETTSKL